MLGLMETSSKRAYTIPKSAALSGRWPCPCSSPLLTCTSTGDTKRLQQYVNREFQTFKLDLKKAEESEIQLPISDGSSEKQESSRKTSISALLTMPKPLTVWITTNWKILQETGIPDHLTCLLRNLYAGQEATVRTGHGTSDWFQIRKEVHQGCILSLGLS